VNVSELFGLKDQVAVVTGASGVLGGEIARGLAGAGARGAVLIPCEGAHHPHHIITWLASLA